MSLYSSEIKRALTAVEKSIISIEAIKEEICGGNVKDFYYSETHKIWIVDYKNDILSNTFKTFIDLYKFLIEE